MVVDVLLASHVPASYRSGEYSLESLRLTQPPLNSAGSPGLAREPEPYIHARVPFRFPATRNHLHFRLHVLHIPPPIYNMNRTRFTELGADIDTQTTQVN